MDSTKAKAGTITTQEMLEQTPRDLKTPPVPSPSPMGTPAKSATPAAPAEHLETGHGGEAAGGNQPSQSQDLANGAGSTNLGGANPTGPSDSKHPHPPQKKDKAQVPHDPTNTSPADTSIYDKGVYWKNLCKC